MSTIPLAKKYTPAKLDYPVYLSHKVDGVPIRIDIHEVGHEVMTRQGKPVPSVQSLVTRMVAEIRKNYAFSFPLSLVGEVAQRGNVNADFKDTSGIVRRQEDQSDQLTFHLFECNQAETFQDRIVYMEGLVEFLDHSEVRLIYQHMVQDEAELTAHVEAFMTAFPEAEGMVARNHNDEWAPGKRSWGYQKVLIEPTIDLRIIGWSPAVCHKTGEPKSMVGRLHAEYKGSVIGVGPGKLTHQERIDLWAGYINGRLVEDCSLIAQVKYKADKSYDALRQPTFQYWRDDKLEPDA